MLHVKILHYIFCDFIQNDLIPSWDHKIDKGKLKILKSTFQISKSNII